MLDRIQCGVAERDRILDSQRLFTANAVHELRTPLTTAHTAIDVTLDGNSSRNELLAMADDVRDAVTHMQRVLNGLLLARSQAGADTREAADLAAITAAALGTAEEQAAAAGIAVHARLRPALVTGEPACWNAWSVTWSTTRSATTTPTGTSSSRRAQRAHAPCCGSATPAARSAPEEAQTLLEPFVHGQGTRVRTDGPGLGLSIVRAITHAHHGHIAITVRPGGGLDITIELPHHSRAAERPYDDPLRSPHSRRP
jgi:signal transduction histidine kinase